LPPLESDRALKFVIAASHVVGFVVVICLILLVMSALSHRRRSKALALWDETTTPEVFDPNLPYVSIIPPWMLDSEMAASEDPGPGKPTPGLPLRPSEAPATGPVGPTIRRARPATVVVGVAPKATPIVHATVKVPVAVPRVTRPDDSHEPLKTTSVSQPTVGRGLVA
jgi:hypothetical protein